VYIKRKLVYHVIIKSRFALIDLMYHIARIVRISFLLVKSDARLEYKAT